MSGLLGSLAAGAAKSYSAGRVNELNRQAEFDMRTAMMDAQMEKEMRLKEAGYEFEKKERADVEASNKAAMDDAYKPIEEKSTTPSSMINKYTDANGQEQTVSAGGEEITTSREPTTQEAAGRLIRSGKTELGKGLLSMAPRTEKVFDQVKLDDGSVLSFDKSTGTGKVIFQGQGKPKTFNSIEEAIVNEDDPKKRAELISIKKQITAAGRAPERASDDDMTFADWKKKPENKGKGRDDYAKEKATWSKGEASTDMEEVTTKTSENDKFGAPVKETTVKSKRPKTLSDPFGLR